MSSDYTASGKQECQYQKSHLQRGGGVSTRRPQGCPRSSQIWVPKGVFGSLRGYERGAEPLVCGILARLGAYSGGESMLSVVLHAINSYSEAFVSGQFLALN